MLCQFLPFQTWAQTSTAVFQGAHRCLPVGCHPVCIGHLQGVTRVVRNAVRLGSRLQLVKPSFVNTDYFPNIISFIFRLCFSTAKRTPTSSCNQWAISQRIVSSFCFSQLGIAVISRYLNRFAICWWWKELLWAQHWVRGMLSADDSCFPHAPERNNHPHKFGK